jgi:hypothetical protein
LNITFHPVVSVAVVDTLVGEAVVGEAVVGDTVVGLAVGARVGTLVGVDVPPPGGGA